MLHIHVYCQKRSIIFKVVEVYEREKKTREITNKCLGYHEELPWQLIKNKGDVIRFKFYKLVIKDMIGWLKVPVNVAQTKLQWDLLHVVSYYTVERQQFLFYMLHPNRL